VYPVNPFAGLTGFPHPREVIVSLDIEVALRPHDLTTAHDTELLEYLAGINADAKRMNVDHLRHPVRHAQINLVIDELERRACLRLMLA
jgi:hypothetical protein